MADLSKAADQWVRSNRKKMITQFCGEDFEPQKKPVTIFMAGTPGAGKTEFSVKLLNLFGNNMVRIDADEIRELMRGIGYNGANAEEFQHAATKGVNVLYDYVLSKKYSAILDGTFAYGNWRENIDRSLQKGRIIEIYYLYQDPLIAWDYVKIRESRQGRAVPLDTFVYAYEESLRNVQKAKSVFADNLTVYFAKNNYIKDVEYVEVDVNDIENQLPVKYTKQELKDLLNARKTD
jgi:predicted ABC-type ATPase